MRSTSVAILLALLGGVLSLLATSLPAAEEELLDRIVAVVDEQPIFLTDIERLIALEWFERRDGESEAELQRRVLDGLIDQRLRAREVERYDFGPVSTVEIERQLELARQRFGGAQKLTERLASVGLDLEDLRYLLAQQYRVLVYVEERLGPRILIDREAVKQYYEQDLAARMQAANEPLPPFEEVREQIREVLWQIRLNEEIETWTEQLRQQAEIVDLLDRPDDRSLPPVVEVQTSIEEGDDPSR